MLWLEPYCSIPEVHQTSSKAGSGINILYLLSGPMASSKCAMEMITLHWLMYLLTIPQRSGQWRQTGRERRWPNCNVCEFIAWPMPSLRNVIICFVNWPYANSLMGTLVNIAMSWCVCILFVYYFLTQLRLLLRCLFSFVAISMCWYSLLTYKTR